MTQNDPAPVPLTLAGEDGNAYAILGRFQREARREGWSPEQITAVMDDAMSGDYDHLLRVMMENTTEEDR
ncbi:MAG TPA: hypothetical protein VIL51_11195 [Thermoleophilia bacterium]